MVPILLLGIYLKEMKSERNTHMPLFIAALFTVAKIWNQSLCPSTDDWIKKCTMEYCVAIKQRKWMELEDIMDMGPSFPCFFSPSFPSFLSPALPLDTQDKYGILSCAN
jgi:hypothetical protein